MRTKLTQAVEVLISSIFLWSEAATGFQPKGSMLYGCRFTAAIPPLPIKSLGLAQILLVLLEDGWSTLPAHRLPCLRFW